MDSKNQAFRNESNGSRRSGKLNNAKERYARVGDRVDAVQRRVNIVESRLSRNELSVGAALEVLEKQKEIREELHKKQEDALALAVQELREENREMILGVNERSQQDRLVVFAIGIWAVCAVCAVCALTFALGVLPS